MKIELGDKVKCNVTGFEGIVTSIAQNLYGCDRIVVQPPKGKDGKVPDSMWADIVACKVVKKGVVKGHRTMNKEDNGGPSLSIQTPKRMP